MLRRKKSKGGRIWPGLVRSRPDRPAGSPASPTPTESVRGHLGHPIRRQATADRRRARRPLHAGARAASARVSRGKGLTKVVRARRSFESATAGSSMTGASAGLACRGWSARVLLRCLCVYGEGVIGLGWPGSKQGRGEVWVMERSSVNQRGGREIS
jgi:hypothetical protein